MQKGVGKKLLVKKEIHFIRGLIYFSGLSNFINEGQIYFTRGQYFKSHLRGSNFIRGQKYFNKGSKKFQIKIKN
jgi:hypothetical protein